MVDGQISYLSCPTPEPTARLSFPFRVDEKSLQAESSWPPEVLK